MSGHFIKSIIYIEVKPVADPGGAMGAVAPPPLPSYLQFDDDRLATG